MKKSTNKLERKKNVITLKNEKNKQKELSE